MTIYSTMTTDRDRLDAIFARLVRANASGTRFTIAALGGAIRDVTIVSGDAALASELSARYTGRYPAAELVGVCLDPDLPCGACWQCAARFADQHAGHLRVGCEDCADGYRPDVLAVDHHGRDDAVSRQCDSGAAPCPAHRCYRTGEPQERPVMAADRYPARDSEEEYRRTLIEMGASEQEAAEAVDDLRRRG